MFIHRLVKPLVPVRAGNEKGRATVMFARPCENKRPLHVSVAVSEHRGKAGNLHLATALLARLLEMAMAADCLQGTLAINPLLQAAQGLLDEFTFLESNLCHSKFTSSRGLGGRATFIG